MLYRVSIEAVRCPVMLRATTSGTSAADRLVRAHRLVSCKTRLCSFRPTAKPAAPALRGCTARPAMAHTVHLEIPRSREVIGSAWLALWRSRRVAARGCGASDAPSAFHGPPGALGRDLQPGRPTWTSRRLA